MKNKTWIWVVGVIVLLFLLLAGGIVVAVKSALRAAAGGAPAGGNVALLHVEGVISSGDGGYGLWGGAGAGSEYLLKKLDAIASNPDFKAIVLRVNSPGGTAAGSQEIYEKLMQIRNKTGKKIVVSMGDVAASGAYYISSAADKIYADPATLTGSIGVIADLMDLHGLFRKIGVSPETLKAGKLKDMGSQNRPLTPEERKIFQTILDEAHNQFIGDVARGRKLPVAAVRALADGRVYTGEQAVRLHLVDTLGNLEDAEQEAARMAGIPGRPKVVNMDQRTLLQQLTGDPSSETSYRQILSRFGSFFSGSFPDGILFLAPGIRPLR